MTEEIITSDEIINSFIYWALENKLATIDENEDYIVVPNITIIIANKSYLLFQDSEKNLHLIGKNRQIKAQHKIFAVFKIANSIAKLPSKNWREKAHTKSLKDEWYIQRMNNRVIAIFFLEACIEIENFDTDVLELITYERQIMHEKAIEILESTAYLYRTLFDLARLTFSDIKKLEKCPFKTPQELCMHIIKEHRNNAFTRLFDNNYIEYLRCNNKKNRTPLHNKWLHLIIKYTQILVNKKNDKAIIFKEDYHRWCNAIEKQIKELYNIRNNKGFLIKSEAWINYECFLFSSDNKPSIKRSELPRIYGEEIE